MRPGLLGLGPLLAACVLMLPGIASGNDELDLIPDALLAIDESVVEPATASPERRWSLQWQLQAMDWRSPGDTVVPTPGLEQPDWSNRFALGYFRRTSLSPDWRSTLGFTLYLNQQQSKAFNTDEDLRLDLKEAYASRDISDNLYLDLGRINLRQGVARGYNPSDYFKDHAVRDNSALDARERRDNRLGTLLLRAETFWDGGALALSIAPDIDPSDRGLSGNTEAWGLALNQTNDRWRTHLRWHDRWSDNFSPDISLYHDQQTTHLGINLSQGIGDRWLIYGEWSGARQPDLLQQGLDSIRQSSELTAAVAALERQEKSFHQRLALGFSYTTDKNITTSFEYHHNGSGFSKEDWRNWFDIGESAIDNGASGEGTVRQLWKLRGFARQSEEPLGRDYLYINSQAQDVRQNLDLGALIRLNLQDQSMLAQINATYLWSGNTTLEWNLRTFRGRSRSEYGSLASSWSSAFRVNYFFQRLPGIP